MWLCYVDECGNTGKRLDDPKQPYHALAAVMVPEESVLALAADGEGLVNRAHEDRWGFKPEQVVELRGVDLYGGTRDWAGIDEEHRNQVYWDAVSLLDTHGCEVAYARIDKVKFEKRKYPRPESPHLLALQFLVEKLDDWLGTQTDPTRQRGLIVADETKEHGDFAIAMVANMQRWGSPIGSREPLTHVIDTVHFVRSKDNPGVQLADLVVYALNRKWMMPKNTDKAGDLFIHKLVTGLIGPRIRKYRLWPA